MALKICLSGDWDLARETRDGLATADGIELVAAADAADAVVHVAGGSPRHELARLREHVRTPIVLLAGAGTEELVDAVLDAEQTEILVRPQLAGAVVFATRRAVATAERRRAEQPAGRVVTVFSPKGGAGKSAVSGNLAAHLAVRGHRTLLLDLDLQFGDAAIMLGLEPERTLHDLFSSSAALDAETIERCALRHRSGLDVVPAPLEPENAEAISDGRIVELLDAARTGYEVTVVDTTPFFHESVLAAIDRTDDLLVVCTPDVPTLKNVRLALQTLDLLGVSNARLRVLLNRANARVGCRAADVAAALEREVELELPDDEAVVIAVNRGVPVVEDAAEAPFSQAIATLAERLLPRATAPRRRRLLAFGRRA